MQRGPKAGNTLQESSDGVKKFRCDQPNQWDGAGNSSQEACIACASSPPYPLPSRKQTRDFLKRVLHDLAVNLKAAKGKNRENSCIRWTTYKNLSLWFENWEHNLVERGFAYQPDHKQGLHS